MLFNLGGLEILAIALLTLIIFGPERLPVLFRQFGTAIRKLRDYYVVLAAQVRLELEPVEEEIREIRQVANELRQDLAEIAEAIDMRALLPNLEAELSEDRKSDKNQESSPKNQDNAAPTISANDRPKAELVIDGPVVSSGLLTPAPSEGNAPESSTGVYHAPVADGASLTLDNDNPWVTFEIPKRIKLDEDNPWAN